MDSEGDMGLSELSFVTVLLVVPLMPATAEAADARSDGTVRVRIIDNAGLSSGERETIADEIDAIWAPRVRVDRPSAKPVESVPRREPAASPTIFVLLRHCLPLDEQNANSATCTGRDRTASLSSAASATTPLDEPMTLAWIPFTGGKASSVVFVSVDRTRLFLTPAAYEGCLVNRSPNSLARLLLGRALGRIAAHEVGHYLEGPLHATTGLMKPILTQRDLLDASRARHMAAGR